MAYPKEGTSELLLKLWQVMVSGDADRSRQVTVDLLTRAGPALNDQLEVATLIMREVVLPYALACARAAGVAVPSETASDTASETASENVKSEWVN